MSQKSTPNDEFDEIYQVVLDGINDNMAFLVEPGTCGAINTTDAAKHGFYVIMFTPEAYEIQDNTTIDRQFRTS